MRIKVLHIFCCLCLIFDSCIERFDIKVDDIQKYVVIDGLISDQPGPYTIKLFRSGSLDDQLTTVNWIRGASLLIQDDVNGSYALTEVSPGNYQTSPNFQGIIGHTYVLQVRISDEEQFESLPQKLLPVGEIEKVYYEFVQLEDSMKTNLAKEPKNGFNIFLNGTIHPDQNRLVRWRTVGTYQITTYPINKTIPTGGHEISAPADINIDDDSGVPDPPPCSGYKYIGGILRKIGDGTCSCCTCWPSIYDAGPILSEPKFLEYNRIEGLKLAFVPARRDYFSNKYHFRVDQMSVTPEAFEYWRKIKKQGGTGSDLFQTPSGRTTGNMRTVGDTKTPIIGLFSVSSIRSVSFFIERKDVPYTLWDPKRFNDSCMKLLTRFNTNMKPDFWR